MIKTLYLNNFRNYRSLELKVDHPVNLFIGRNGQGKTNILEAIFFVSMLRSFRTLQIRELKMIGQKDFSVGAEVTNPNGWNELLKIGCSDNKRKLTIDGKTVPKASEFIKRLRTVVFSPDDIAIVNGNSAIRRRFFDFLISMMEPDYLISMQSYSIALKSRNILLKRHSQDYALLLAYETILAREGALITAFRDEYSRILMDSMKNLLANFYDKSGGFRIKYHPLMSSFSEDSFLERFEQERERDIRRGFSTFGPQTDEFDFFLNHKLMRHFGSNGQCRLVALCLKMASVEILSMKENTADIVVLVDDVTGDLDPVVKKIFFQKINKAGQIFFTFTESPNDEFFKDSSVFQVNDGTVEGAI
mgnify:CR=1 FL=1|jgi:DNA replication and repair protein RecF